MDADQGPIDASNAEAPGSPADERGGGAPAPGVSLTAALRRARVDSLERSDAVGDVRATGLARLDLLREHLEPVFAQIPADCDMFDLGMTQGEQPRLFVDMIAFVELAHNRRGYRFLQDTRNGRLLLAESENIDAMTQSVTDYIARRLVERERALAADAALAAPAPARSTDAAVATAPPSVQPARALSDARAPRRRPGALRLLAGLFLFVVEVLGSAAFFSVLAIAAYWLWLRTHG